MLINLYMSRVVLAELGVDDYGIYNAVGGVVGMFSIVSGALSGSISRYITFELGKGTGQKLNIVFSTSVNIMLGISFIVLFFAEPICVWFLNTQMNIPDGRLEAANWVLQCSIMVFCVNLISVPYNAAIIAHERMSAFAYISILDAVLRLIIVFLLGVLPFDKLVSFAILLMIVAVIIRVTYGVYCGHHFPECHYKFASDSKITREMTSFAGWSFLTNSALIFNTQGVNVLTNLYFGVGMNAARGIATQVDNAVLQFVSNFTMALNPQITKNYALGNKQEMFRLVCMGSKYSFYLMLLFALPLIAEADYILSLWLGGNVPPKTALFVKLGIIAAIVDRFGSTMTTACLATGTIRKYTLWVSIVGCTAFLLSWLFFGIGLSAESAYIAFTITYLMVNVTRLFMMKVMLGFPPMMYVREVLFKAIPTLVLAFVAPFVIVHTIDSSFSRLMISLFCCSIFTLFSVFSLGMSKSERSSIVNMVFRKLSK
jgi:O-antigen/teichoic acid export membrane protein